MPPPWQSKGVSSFFDSKPLVFGSGILLRVALLAYGSYQDAHSSLKYTDIDYFVFTDAARFLSRSKSPYDRATYRYTPLLAMLLLPTAWPGWFDFGKALFAASDIFAGWLMLAVLRSYGVSETKALRYTCGWLLNPMVATISTRGSSEGLLCAVIIALLWAVESHRILLAGVLLGLSVHLKIYPFIYGISIFWGLQPNPTQSISGADKNRSSTFFHRDRVTLLAASISTFFVLNLAMFATYGFTFLEHTFFYHLTRVDHRHNFSPYNTLLYLSSAYIPNSTSRLNPASLAFLPQLTLSGLLIPFSLARRSLPASLLAQTQAFVTFNKVCTSQYFLWYLAFLPLYLPDSVLMRRPRLGTSVGALWVAGQVFWLREAYQLEFLGRSAFVPGLWIASFLFFGVNCWILGVIVGDEVVKVKISNIYHHVSSNVRQVKTGLKN
jgi:GPI mannosyltransferase 1 subunit M